MLFLIYSNQTDSRVVYGIQCLLSFNLPINTIPLGDLCTVFYLF